jgi:LysR family hydrogen peroxide-inducible transcriptional activator|tara:strand:+ start:356 stop:1279 length:924 start_codon:yes stop_codon:yes gene_type:complete
MAHLPTLRQLRYLCAVAKLKHFGNAASACNVSQSTLSAAINGLENTLGVSLIERNNKRVLMTPLGEQIVGLSHTILSDVEDLVAECTASKEPLSSSMHMGVIPTVAPFVLPRLLKGLRGSHPGFKLYIKENLSDQLVEALLQAELDLLFLALPFPADGVEKLHLFYDDFLLAYQANDKFDDLPAVNTRDLKGKELLLLEDGHCLKDHVLDACKLRMSDISVPYMATSLNTIVQMVANDIGMTLLPRMAIDARILTGTRIKTKPFLNQGVRRSIGLMWRKNSPRREEFELLARFIQELYPQEASAARG